MSARRLPRSMSPPPVVLATRVLLAALLLLPVVACTGGADAPPPPATPTPISQSEEHLGRAIDYLTRYDEFDPTSVRRRIHHHLSQWILEQPPNREWSADPLIQQLPERYQVKLAVGGVGDRYFLGGFPHDDIYFLREAMVMHDLADWVAAGEVHDPAMAAWLAAIAEEHGVDYAEQLTAAWLLFDWTVRNVQLDSTPTVEDLLLPEGATVEDELPDNPGSPELRARRLAGAKYGAWEAVRLGHGDALTRSHIFALLVRQWSDMEVVLVATQRVEGLPRVWSTGLMLGEEIYLFDTELGLPIPTAGGEGIATLNEVLKSPALLRQLDLPEEPYPVTAEELEPVYLLVIASPGYLSERMELIERSMPAESRVQLSVSPSRLATNLRKHRGVADVLLWIGPYEQYQYMERLSKSVQASNLWGWEHEPYSKYTPLSGARDMHLVGQFDSPPPIHGAKELYLLCRPSNREIAGFDLRAMAEAKLRESGEMPIDVSEQTAAIEAAMLDIRREQLRALRMKLDATYWLGLVGYDDGDYQTAANYFRDRVLEADLESPWENGARYNLARSYEMLAAENIEPALLEKAIELYESDDSPQRRGNLLRARRLTQELASAEAETLEPAAETPAKEPAEVEAEDAESAEPEATEAEDAPAEPAAAE